MKKGYGFFFLIVFSLVINGCGYTSKTVLPKHIQSIYVETVVNSIPLKDVRAYRPGLEIDVTDAITKRLNLDGNLKVVAKEDADAILESHLIGFEQSGVRFDQLERVEEFRMHIVLSMRLLDVKSSAVLWEEPNFSGTVDYFVSDVRSIAREEASQRALERLARNVVDRIVEDW